MKKITLTIISTLLMGMILLAFSPIKSLLHKTKLIFFNQNSGFDGTIKKENDSVPLILMTTFFNPQGSIPKSEIKNLLNQGKIYCTTDISAAAKNIFNSTLCQTISINKADLTSDSLMILTSIDSVDHRFLAMKIDSVNFFQSPNSYPLWYKDEKNNEFNFTKQITSYTHTGVTAITRSTGNVLDNIGIDRYIEKILPFFKTPEIVHISNEVSISDSADYKKMKMKFASKPRDFEILKRLRTNIVELTGNHNLDFGKDAYLNTLEWYKNNQIKYFGGGMNKEDAIKPLIIKQKDGSKVAWIGFNELCPCGECAGRPGLDAGANRYNKEEASDLINQLKKSDKVDYIISCVQFGERDSYQPSETQKKICKELIDFGADVVIGSQAHQPQEIALYKNKLIFFGTGNFLFDQIHRIGVRQAFFLECYFYKGKIIQFQPVYTFMGLDRIPALAGKHEKDEIKKSIIKKQNFKEIK